MKQLEAAERDLTRRDWRSFAARVKAVRGERAFAYQLENLQAIRMFIEGSREQAAEQLARLADRAPACARLQLNAGVAATVTEQAELAAPYLDRAAEFGEVRALIYLAQLHLRHGDVDLARPALEELALEAIGEDLDGALAPSRRDETIQLLAGHAAQLASVARLDDAGFSDLAGLAARAARVSRSTGILPVEEDADDAALDVTYVEPEAPRGGEVEPGLAQLTIDKRHQLVTTRGALLATWGDVWAEEIIARSHAQDAGPLRVLGEDAINLIGKGSVCVLPRFGNRLHPLATDRAIEIFISVPFFCGVYGDWRVESGSWPGDGEHQILYLRGKGLILFQSSGALRGFEVTEQSPFFADRNTLCAWTGECVVSRADRGRRLQYGCFGSGTALFQTPRTSE